jgi:hypothetical protein
VNCHIAVFDASRENRSHQYRKSFMRGWNAPVAEWELDNLQAGGRCFLEQRPDVQQLPLTWLEQRHQDDGGIGPVQPA